MSTLRLMAIDAICQRGSIREPDVLTLRRAFALEPQLHASEIDALFRVHALARVQDPAWADFFAEILTDYVVRELEPAGYVTSAHAAWLVARVSSAGRVRTKAEHDLLLNVIDKARWVPASLMAFALAQIRDAVRTGDGPLRAGAETGPGTITLLEVEQVRSLLFAYGNEGPKAITEIEAELLLDIDGALRRVEAARVAHEAILRSDSWPVEPWRLDGWPQQAWSDLLDKAIANAVLSASGYACPTREEALNEARPLTSPQAALQGYRPMTPEARALLRLELQRIEIITGEPVRPADPVRLAEILDAEQHEGIRARVLRALLAADCVLSPAFAPGRTCSDVAAA